MLELDQLRVLVAISESGSLAGAARELYRSQPTISHHLAALEGVIGGRLVERGPTGARLTELGEAVCQRATAILAGADRLEFDARAQSLFSLRIGAFPSAATALLAEPLRSLRERRYGFQLDIDEPKEIARRCRDLAYDVAIIATESDTAPTLADGLISEAILTDPLLVLLPPGHRLFNQDTLSLEDLTDEQWITATDDLDPEHVLLRRVFSDAGRDLQPTVRADDFAVTQAFVVAGLGLALLPQLARAQIATGLQTRTVADTRFARHIHTVWCHDRPGTADLVKEIRIAALAWEFGRLASSETRDTRLGVRSRG